MGQTTNPVKRIAPCVADGPSINDTLVYLNKGLPVVGGRNQSISVDATKWTMTYTYRYSAQFRDEIPLPQPSTAPIQMLSCSTGIYVDSGDGSMHIVGICESNVNCMEIASCPVGLDRGCSYSNGNSFVLDFGSLADPSQVELNARALSHLIFLLQQQYKSAHAHANDPFAKP
jgi:hypothetical protein